MFHNGIGLILTLKKSVVCVVIGIIYRADIYMESLRVTLPVTYERNPDFSG